MKMKFYVFISLVFIISILNSCVYDVESELGGNSDCEFTAVSYASDVLPIISENCYMCHSESEATAGIILEGYNELFPKAESGLLFCVINHDDGCTPMPNDLPQLPECDILLIKTWIDEGAQNN